MSGVSEPAWTTAMVQEFVSYRFGMEYSRESCRRLLREAGLEPMAASSTVHEIDGVVDSAELRRLGRVWIPV